jgi:hypothetical protein
LTVTVGDIPQRRGKNADPEFQSAKGRRMAAVRNSLGNHFRHVINRVDELTPEQRQQLAFALALDLTGLSEEQRRQAAAVLKCALSAILAPAGDGV